MQTEPVFEETQWRKMLSADLVEQGRKFISRDEIVEILAQTFSCDAKSLTDSAPVNLATPTTLLRFLELLNRAVEKKSRRVDVPMLSVYSDDLEQADTVEKLVASIQGSLGPIKHLERAIAESEKLNKNKIFGFILDTLEELGIPYVTTSIKFSDICFTTSKKDSFLDALRKEYKQLPIDGMDAFWMMRGTVERAADILLGRLQKLEARPSLSL